MLSVTVVNANVISVNYGLHVLMRLHVNMTLATFNERLEKAEIDINRKMLSEIAISDDKAFAELVSKAKEALK